MATAATEVSVHHRPGNSAVLGARTALAIGALFVAALCGAYVAVRHGVGKEFVPTAMSFNNYAAVMIGFSAVLASFVVEWAYVSLKVGQRRWVSGGYGLAALLGVAAMNLVWLIGAKLGLAVNDINGYALLVYALLAAAMLLFAMGVVASLTNMVRCLGGHASAAEPLLARAGNSFVHLASAGWLAVFALIFLYK